MPIRATASQRPKTTTTTTTTTLGYLRTSGNRLGQSWTPQPPPFPAQAQGGGAPRRGRGGWQMKPPCTT
eukprot:4437385-Pyramimonas_sp.AAC.1